jgi:type IV pilus assembly protein PilY1
MDVVKAAAKRLLDSPMVEGMNVGLMRYSTNKRDDFNTNDTYAEGGMIIWPVSPLTTDSRASMKSLIDGLIEAGRTPLSETLFEAQQYFAGGDVVYGNTSRLCTRNGGGTSGGNAACVSDSDMQDFPSVAASRLAATPAKYKSPADVECQRNYIVFLTDGEPTSDGTSGSTNGVSNGVRGKAESLEEWDSLGLACDTTRSASEGQCLAAISAYMS